MPPNWKQGINNLQDVANIDAAKVEELDALIKGFKARFTNNDWSGQAKKLINQ